MFMWNMWLVVGVVEVFDAVYENGVLKPLKRVNLREGERVRVRVERRVSDETFGVLKVKFEDIDRVLRELEDEWGIC